jgi:hypothetical protein
VEPNRLPQANGYKNCERIKTYGVSTSCFRLLFNFGVLLHEFPVGIDFEAPFFPARFDDDLVVPLAIRVVFPFYLNDLPARCLLIDCLLDGGR